MNVKAAAVVALAGGLAIAVTGCSDTSGSGHLFSTGQVRTQGQSAASSIRGQYKADGSWNPGTKPGQRVLTWENSLVVSLGQPIVSAHEITYAMYIVLNKHIAKGPYDVGQMRVVMTSNGTEGTLTASSGLHGLVKPGGNHGVRATVSFKVVDPFDVNITVTPGPRYEPSTFKFHTAGPPAAASEREPNDHGRQANGPLRSGGITLSANSPNDPRDWFWFRLRSRQQATLTATRVGGDCDTAFVETYLPGSGQDVDLIGQGAPSVDNNGNQDDRIGATPAEAVSGTVTYHSGSDGVELGMVEWNSDGANTACSVRVTLDPPQAIDPATPSSLKALLADPEVNPN